MIVRRVTWGLWMLTLSYAVWGIVYASILTVGWISLVATVLTAGIVVAVIIAWRRTIVDGFAALTEPLCRPSNMQFLTLCIVVGGALRVIWVAFFPPLQVSDSATYVQLATALIEEGRYGADMRAFWPPGFPFLLVVPLALAGGSEWSLVVLNLMLFVAILLVVHLIGTAIGGRQVARPASALITIWPNIVFASGLATKELALAVLLPLALVSYRFRTAHDGRPRLVGALAAGLCIGFAALTQPGTALFPAVLIALEILEAAGLRVALKRLSTLGLGMVLIIAPWTVRNYLVLDAFVPISTNGGVVFLSANNERATGGWIKMSDWIKMNSGDYVGNEVTINSLAYRQAIEWILNNPARFAVLAIKKQARFLSDDATSAFITLRLAHGIEDARLRAATIVSNLFWYAILVLSLAGAVMHRGSRFTADPLVLTLAVAVFYFLAIHSVFQSESRHHLNVAASFAILASVAAQPGPKNRAVLSAVA